MVRVEWENDTNCSPHPNVFFSGEPYLCIALFKHRSTERGVATLPKHISRGFRKSMCLCPEVAVAGDIVGDNAQVLPGRSSDPRLHLDCASPQIM